MSSSSSKKSSDYDTSDNRVAVDGESVGISGGRDVTVHMVPDEAFGLAETSLLQMGDFGELALNAVADTARDTSQEIGTALFRSLEAQREESAKLGEQLIRVGVPAAALAFVAASVWGK